MSADLGPAPAIALQLADFVAGIQPSSIPADVSHDAIWRLSDTIGVALVGARLEHSGALRSFLDDAGGGGPCTVIGFGVRAPAQIAALVNGALAHGADFDDTHGQALLHISSVVVPTALALGERAGASGADLMTAVIVGAEAGLRIGLPVGKRLLLRGLHPTGIVGPFAAAATASRLLSLDPARTAHALGLAGSEAAGLRQGSHDGSWAKRLHPGWAAQAGILAALLAARGFTGPAEVLEGGYGLYAALLHGEPVDTESVCRDLGERWLYPETTYKPYPNGSWNHTAMGAVAEIMRAEGIGYPDIERIDCTLPEAGYTAVCAPRDVRLNPKTAYHMKFSLPYSIAILAVLGHVNPDDYVPSTLADRRISDLAARVYCRADPAMPPTSFPARIRVTTRDGRTFAADVAAQKGSRGNPMTPEDHRDKFLNAAEPALGAGPAGELGQRIEGIWSASDPNELTDLMAHP